MPTAHAGETKYAYLDHDTAVQDLTPPVLNQWYTIADEEDVRAIYCKVLQSNDEAAAKDIEFRWTLDGTVYFTSFSLPNTTWYSIMRDYTPSLGGISGIIWAAAAFNAALYADKRAQSFKVEFRITSALGTNQRLLGYFIYETLEQT